MYRKIIANSVLILAVTAVQLSLIDSLPSPWNNFNLILSALIYIFIAEESSTALIWLFGLGFLLDIFSFHPFGVYLLSLALSMLLVYSLLFGFFTNRSLYSLLALGFFATLGNAFFFNLADFFLSRLTGGFFAFNLNWIFFRSFFSQAVLNLAAVYIIFHTLHYLSNRFRPVFLSSNDSK